MRNCDKKKESYEFGKFAEETAALNYISRGYTILERRWRMGKNEIDLIAQKDDEIIFIEVKARKDNEEEAVSAVNCDKRKRMIRSADAFISRQKGRMNYRFDIVTCIGTPKDYKLDFIENAFFATDLF